MNRKTEILMAFNVKTLVMLTILVIANPAQAAEFYVSPTGDDANPGTASEPWASIQRMNGIIENNVIVGKLEPGDTLNVADGVYVENVEPKISGTDQAPITVRAINPYAVTIDADSNGPVLLIKNVSYLDFAGFKLINSSLTASVLQLSSIDGQPATGNTDTHHITLRKISVRGTCQLSNCNAALIARANNILLEDSWIYGNGRYTLLVYGSREITVRRTLIRWDEWLAGTNQPNDPRIAMGVYNTHDSIFENVLVIDAGIRTPGRTGDKKAFALAGGNNGNTAPFTSSKNNMFLGMVIVNNIGLPLGLEARSAPHEANLFENIVVYGNTFRAVTLSKEALNNTFNHMTLAAHPDEGIAVNGSNALGTMITNSIILNNGRRAFRGSLTETYNMVFGNTPNYASHNHINPGEGSLVMDPELEYLFRNDTLPLLDNPGSDNLPRGATLLLRYINGIESIQPLWPWPNEDLILQDLCDPMSLTELGRIDDNSAPWCDSGKSLTRYLWELGTNNDCPAAICGPADLVFSNGFE